MRADMAYRKSGLTQAILLVECGLVSGIREDEKIQTFVQSYSREIDKHNIPEGPQLQSVSADFLYLAVKVHFWQLGPRKSRPSCRHTYTRELTG